MTIFEFEAYCFTGSIDTSGLEHVNMDEIFSLPKDYWIEDIRETKQFLDDQLTTDLPPTLKHELDEQEKRIHAM